MPIQERWTAPRMVGPLPLCSGCESQTGFYAVPSCSGCGFQFSSGEDRICGACWSRLDLEHERLHPPPVVRAVPPGAENTVLMDNTGRVLTAPDCPVVEVTSCEGCSFRTYASRQGQGWAFWCSFPARGASREVPDSGPVPTWCPLRGKGVLFKLVPGAKGAPAVEPKTVWERLADDEPV
jgi:hypothetical protein